MFVWGIVHSIIFYIFALTTEEDKDKSTFRMICSFISSMFVMFILLGGFAIHKAFDSFDSIRQLENYKKGIEQELNISEFIEFYLWSDAYIQGVTYGAIGCFIFFFLSIIWALLSND
ncbi:hypothetical protein [Pseudoalteromonas marina]|uniref:hypothetical protein n=1 Tax=Pseudoalteromonas marina TaxID=267375 RepID=UPI0023F0F460|nr:hypothetical protein [Pseudoalteromonas marina]